MRTKVSIETVAYLMCISSTYAITCKQTKDVYRSTGCCDTPDGNVSLEYSDPDIPGLSCIVSDEATRIGLTTQLEIIKTERDKFLASSYSERLDQAYVTNSKAFGEPLVYFMSNFSNVLDRELFPSPKSFSSVKKALLLMRHDDDNSMVSPLYAAAHYYIATELNGGVDKAKLTIEEARGYNYLRDSAVGFMAGGFVHNLHRFCSNNAGLWYHPADMDWPSVIHNAVTTADVFINSALRFDAGIAEVMEMAKERYTECAEYGFPLPARATTAMVGLTGRGYNLVGRISSQTDNRADSLNTFPKMNTTELEKVNATAKAAGYDDAIHMYTQLSRKFYKHKREYADWWVANLDTLIGPEEESLPARAKPNAYRYTSCVLGQNLTDNEIYYGGDECSGGFHKSLKTLTCIKDMTAPTRFADLVTTVEEAFPGTSSILTHPNIGTVVQDKILENMIDYPGGLDAWYDVVAGLNETYQRTYYTKLAQTVGTDADLMDRQNDALYCKALDDVQSVPNTQTEATFFPWPTGCQPYAGDSYINNSNCPFLLPECNATAYYASGRDPAVCPDPSVLVLRERDFSVCPNIDANGDWSPNTGAIAPNLIVSPYEALPGTCDGLYAVWNFLGKQVAPFGTFFADMVKNFFFNRGDKSSVSACPSGIFPNFNDNWYSYKRSKTQFADELTENDAAYYSCDTAAYGSYDVQDMLRESDYRSTVQTFIHEQTIGHSLQIERFRDVQYNNPKFGRDSACGYSMADGSSSVYEGFASYSDGFMAFEYGNLGTLFGPTSDITQARDIINTAFNAYADIAVPSGRDTFDEAVMKFNYGNYPSNMRCPNFSTSCSKANTDEPSRSIDFTRFTNRAHLLPFQMSSYIMGFANAVALHNKWKAVCGDKWDIREFHHAMMKDGSLPLDITSSKIDEYMSELCGVASVNSKLYAPVASKVSVDLKKSAYVQPKYIHKPERVSRVTRHILK